MAVDLWFINVGMPRRGWRQRLPEQMNAFEKALWEDPDIQAATIRGRPDTFCYEYKKRPRKTLEADHA